MQRTMISTILISLLMVNSLLAAEKKTDFTGYWVINKDSSKVDARGYSFLPVELAIIQKDSQISISQIYDGEFVDDIVLTLDGKENKSKWMNGERIASASWVEDKHSLLIKTTAEMGEGKMVNQWTLKLKSKVVLSIDYQSESGFGSRKAILVYTKLN